MRLNFRDIGCGEPFIVLHGLYGSSDNWMSVGRRLSAQHRMILVDLRNHGLSPQSSTHTYQAMASDVKELIDSEGLNNPCLMGHSMGGKVAMLLATLYPNLFRKLIVVDIAPSDYGKPHDLNNQLYASHQGVIDALGSIATQGLTSRVQADMLLAEHIDDLGVRQFLIKNLLPNTRGGYRWKFNLSALSGALDEVMSNPLNREPAERVALPTLFIRGDKSPYIGNENLKDIDRYFSNFRVDTLAGAGHWPHVAKVEAFLSSVVAFLRDG